MVVTRKKCIKLDNFSKTLFGMQICNRFSDDTLRAVLNNLHGSMSLSERTKVRTHAFRVRL